MKLIEQALNKAFKIDKELMKLYDIIRNSNLNIDKKKEFIDYIINIDMLFGELEIKLEEMNIKESE